MELTPKKGIVALLDALGTRTGTIENAVAFLQSVEKIRANIGRNLEITLQQLKDKPELREMLAGLRFRFFGDTILFTYEIIDEKRFIDYFHRLAFVLNTLMLEAIDLGILFRRGLDWKVHRDGRYRSGTRYCGCRIMVRQNRVVWHNHHASWDELSKSNIFQPIP